MTSLDQVEKLRAMGNISYDEAKGALAAANDDLLEAIIILEKQGKIISPSLCKTNGGEKQNKCDNGGETFTALLKKFGKFFRKMVHKGNANYFEVLKGEESKVAVPVTALVVLLIFAFWVVIPLTVIGLFFGFRYRFKGSNFMGKTVNDAMNSAANAAINLKKSINK